MEFTLADLEFPVRLRFDRPMSDEDLLRFCARNDTLRVERDSNGELTLMSPTGGGTGNANALITFQLVQWAEADGHGTVFDSNSGFRLADGSVRSPDASWVSWVRWNDLSREEKRGFVPLCPEFLIELRSPTDSLPDLQAKMGEWLRNGAELAWLIDPERQVVEVYRHGTAQPDVLEGITSVFGEDPVAGFVLELSRIWQL